MLGADDTVVVPEAIFKWDLLRGLAGDTLDGRWATARLEGSWQFAAWQAPAVELPARVAYGDLIRSLAAGYATAIGRSGAEVFVDHTPGNIRYAATFARLFPDAIFLNLVRDGRGVAASVLPLGWGPNTVEKAATWWSLHVALGLAATTYLPGPQRVLTVRYEDLLGDPDATVRTICRFVGLRDRDAATASRGYRLPAYTRHQHALVNSQVDRTRAAAWRDVLSDRQIERFEHTSFELLEMLGYEPVHGHTARPAARGERARDVVTDGLRRVAVDRVRRTLMHARGRREAAHA